MVPAVTRRTLLLAAGASSLLRAQFQTPNNSPYKPTADELEAIRSKRNELDAILQEAPGAPPEVGVCLKAADWVLRFPEELYRARYAPDAVRVLDLGIERAAAMARGDQPWQTARGRLARAYRSRVDGSLQPYSVAVPHGYDGLRPIRLDVILHGRNARLSEVSFIAAQLNERPVREDRITLEVFGRTNNAYRWSGETDVFEALEAVTRNYRIDEDRILLRGFSMGGAGAWQIGLHHPDRWAGIEAGAGFTDTLRYAANSLPEGGVTPYQRETLRIYDAVDYTPNAYNLAVVGYGGEDDAQLQASVNIREALAADGAGFIQDGLDSKTTSLRALFLVGPKTGHRFHFSSQPRSEAYLSQAVERGRRSPDKLRFVTYTTRYPSCFWVRVDGLETHYKRAEVTAERQPNSIEVHTANVSRLVISNAAAVRELSIDDSAIEVASGSPQLFLGKGAGEWRVFEDLASLRGNGMVKRPGLQGPIDDAFTASFVCVAPQGPGFHPATDAAANSILELFAREYPKWLRADLPMRAADAVSDEDIRDSHLVLFGDPANNPWIERVLSDMPLAWEPESLTLGGRRFAGAEHLPAMIYPNPLNPERYVVLNSGHTFHEHEFRGTNALLYPRLGDFAVLRANEPTQAAQAGLFDDVWKAAE